MDLDLATKNHPCRGCAKKKNRRQREGGKREEGRRGTDLWFRILCILFNGKISSFESLPFFYRTIAVCTFTEFTQTQCQDKKRILIL